MTTDDKLLVNALERLASSSEVTQPPVPQLLIRGRRARSRRILGMFATAAIAVAGTLTVAFMVATAISPPTPPQLATQESPSVADPPEQEKFQLSKATEARLRDVVDKALKAAAPGAQWLESSTYSTPNQAPNVSTLGGDTSRQQMHTMGGVILHDGRRGGFGLGVDAPEYCNVAKQGKENCDSPEYIQKEAQKEREAMLSCREKFASRIRCVESSGPHGERIVAMSYLETPLHDPRVRRSNTVYLVLSDGRVLRVSTGNEIPDPVKKSVVAQPEPPLSEQQLVRIAVQVAAYIKP